MTVTTAKSSGGLKPDPGRSSSTTAFVPPTGTVSFSEAGSSLGTATLDAGVAPPLELLGELARFDSDATTTTSVTLTTTFPVPAGGSIFFARAASGAAAPPGFSMSFKDPAAPR